MEMSAQVKASRRRYNSPLRADQARQTRARILDAAYRLFADGGYARTTIAAVADEAGVSPETIYLTLGGKRGLLEGVIEMAIAPEADPSTQEEELWNELAQVPAEASVARGPSTLSFGVRRTRSRSLPPLAAGCCAIG